jgi:hypothetical protein
MSFSFDAEALRTTLMAKFAELDEARRRDDEERAARYRAEDARRREQWRQEDAKFMEQLRNSLASLSSMFAELDDEDAEVEVEGGPSFEHLDHTSNVPFNLADSRSGQETATDSSSPPDTDLTHLQIISSMVPSDGHHTHNIEHATEQSPEKPVQRQQQLIGTNVVSFCAPRYTSVTNRSGVGVDKLFQSFSVTGFVLIGEYPFHGSQNLLSKNRKKEPDILKIKSSMIIPPETNTLLLLKAIPPDNSSSDYTPCCENYILESCFQGGLSRSHMSQSTKTSPLFFPQVTVTKSCEMGDEQKLKLPIAGCRYQGNAGNAITE